MLGYFNNGELSRDLACPVSGGWLKDTNGKFCNCWKLCESWFSGLVLACLSSYGISIWGRGSCCWTMGSGGGCHKDLGKICSCSSSKNSSTAPCMMYFIFCCQWFWC